MELAAALKDMFAQPVYAVLTTAGVGIRMRTVGLVVSRNLEDVIEEYILKAYHLMKLRRLRRPKLSIVTDYERHEYHVREGSFVTIAAEFNWQIQLSLKLLLIPTYCVYLQ
jgi:hypothetical protein